MGEVERTTVRGEGVDPRQSDGVAGSGEAITLTYTDRFGCIGPDCEDHCCYFWRVDIDKRTYDKMNIAMAFAPGATRDRYRKAIRVHKPKKKRDRERYTIKMSPETGCCPMQEPTGLCHIQAVFGASYLSDTCALYPRKFVRLGDRMEVTAVASCPEVSRQLLLFDDATEEVPFDIASVGRRVPQQNMDLRDVRPYLRMMLECRDFVVKLLRDESQTVRQRLFHMIWFAKRTSAILRKDNFDQDVSAVEREMAMLSNPAVRREIGERFTSLETPSGLVIILARQLVHPELPATSIRPKFRKLIHGVFSSYDDLSRLVSLSEAEWRKSNHMRSLEGVFKEYATRRDMTLSRAQARVDQYLRNVAIYYWYNRNVVEAPDLMTFLLRLLTEMACQKFLLFSHPKVLAALNQGDAMDDEAFVKELDEAAVECFYNVGRFMEHGSLITSLERALDKRGLRSLAGAVYLLKF